MGKGKEVEKACVMLEEGGTIDGATGLLSLRSFEEMEEPLGAS